MEPKKYQELSNEGENCAAQEPFALQVLDDSMYPEFEKDCIVIIDPSVNAKNGDYVLYETDKSLILRKIEIINKINLLALNKDYKSIEIKEEDKKNILGVVTQRSGKKRDYHKKYG
ncbi:MAG: S24 family peptidase [Pseudomonadota bacterium]|nr:S24 family peptidase [Pseudomonadota bacterium]|tara:strand:- start:22 stop:369 length:348 start_codon:yes stop_codon:yes gene_type:complete